MHNLNKIKFFRIALWITYPICLLFVFPFALVRKKNKSHLFFFFDRYSIGGAQRVHLDILESVSNISKKVYFTRKSQDNKLKDQFYSLPNTESLDIHIWCDYLFFRLFSVHYFAFYLNRHHPATILSANSTFFYDMLPYLSNKHFRIELLHNFSYGKNGMEFFGLANYKHLEKRMVIDKFTKENIVNQYNEYQIPNSCNNRVELVEFGVKIPDQVSKEYALPLKILYAGRGGIQKRVWLINKIAEYFIASDTTIQFHFAGPAISEVSDNVKRSSIIHGEISDHTKMTDIYKLCHVLLLTSAFEGFPMVIKECMAYGCVPVVTALPGNMTHLSHLQNALLIREVTNEEEVVKEAITILKLLLNDAPLVAKLSRNAYEYAKENFRKEYFIRRYHELLSAPKYTKG